VEHNSKTIAPEVTVDYEIQLSYPDHIALLRDSSGVYTQGPRTGRGTSVELALAATVAIAIAQHYCEPLDNFFVAGHHHEQLSKGSVSVAWEGGVKDWVASWPDTDRAKTVAAQENVWFEAINGCTLAVRRGI
jgi:hypothetical protein